MKHKWSEQQVIAIKASLEHWYENLMLLELNELLGEADLDKDISIYGEQCALCVEFSSNVCFDCPLKMIGQKCSNDYSAWLKVSYALNDRDSSYSDIRKTFLNMIKTLESLLE